MLFVGGESGFHPSELTKLVDKFGREDASLLNVCTLTVVLVGYAGFLRFDELSNLKESDVQILEEHMELFIESNKTDQYRDGA